MALLFMDGFDQYTGTAETGRGGWTGGAGTTRWTPVTGRIDGKGVSGSLDSNNLIRNFTDSATVIVGFAYKNLTGLSVDEMLLLNDDSSNQIQLFNEGNGEVSIRRNGTVLETSVGLGLLVDVWRQFELKVTINNTTGAYELRVDGGLLFSDTSVDTQNSANATVNNVQLVGNSNYPYVYDDFYLLDTTGSDATDFLGDCHIETVFPDADGNENDFTRVGGGTNNYEAVDDGATADDDTTYNWSSTATDRELYGFAALSGNVDTVYAVQASMLVRKEDAGFRELRTVARSNVTEVESASQTCTTDYSFISHIYENDPNGGINWTETSVNAAQFGVDLHT